MCIILLISICGGMGAKITTPGQSTPDPTLTPNPNFTPPPTLTPNRLALPRLLHFNTPNPSFTSASYPYP